MSNIKLNKLILCAFFAAFTAVCSQIAIPLPFTPVPINLATLSVFLSGIFLGAKYGTLSQIVYLLLGLVGLPVFSHFSSGPAIVFGPTGGYLIGYALAAFLIGLLTQKHRKFCTAFFPLVLILSFGLLLCYIAGTLWFMYLTKTNLLPALSLCVLPFLPGDALKIIAATLLAKKLDMHKLL